jgi:hypothetical protein
VPISGGAPLAKEIADFFDAVGIRIVEGYGLTECTTACTTNRLDRYRFGTVGPALPGFEIEIAEDGEILVRSETIFQGYFKDPEATTAVLTPDGWLRTGDVGEIDEDGFLRITDRKKDILVTAGGKNVAPQNIENELKTSKYVSQALVVGDRRPYVAALITLDRALGRRTRDRRRRRCALRAPTGAGTPPGGRRQGESRAVALRAGEAVRDPAPRLHHGARRGHADAQAAAPGGGRPLPAGDRRAVRLGGLGETGAEPPGRAARPEAASSVAPIATAIGAPCVLASERPSHPDDERRSAKPS